jgi:hypothetical protein
MAKESEDNISAENPWERGWLCVARSLRKEKDFGVDSWGFGHLPVGQELKKFLEQCAIKAELLAQAPQAQ